MRLVGHGVHRSAVAVNEALTEALISTTLAGWPSGVISTAAMARSRQSACLQSTGCAESSSCIKQERTVAIRPLTDHRMPVNDCVRNQLRLVVRQPDVVASPAATATGATRCVALAPDHRRPALLQVLDEARLSEFAHCTVAPGPGGRSFNSSTQPGRRRNAGTNSCRARRSHPRPAPSSPAP